MHEMFLQQIQPRSPSIKNMLGLYELIKLHWKHVFQFSLKTKQMSILLGAWESKACVRNADFV